MKVPKPFPVLLSLIMAAALFSCSVDLQKAEESCPQSKSYCFTVGYSQESTGDGSIKSCSTASGTYVEGTEIVVAAAPCKESKSYFTGWYDAPCGGKLVSTETTYRFELEKNRALYARFDKSSGLYSFSAGKSPESIGEGTVTSSKPNGSYPAGTEIEVTARYDYSRYNTFEGWFDAPRGGRRVTKENRYRFRLRADTAIYARFGKREYTFAMGHSDLSSGWGTVKSSKENGSYHAGTEISLEAKADSKSSFAGWFTASNGGRLVSSEAKYSFKIYGNIELYARFYDKAQGGTTGFIDPVLERLVRKALNRPNGELTKEELARITALGRPDGQITDLSGLEQLTGLTSLRLDFSRITDLSPLADLVKLKQLSLAHCGLVDLSPLAALTNLVELNLIGNKIRDASVIAGLTNLESLSLKDNLIEIMPRELVLNRVTYINLINNRISTLPSKMRMERLERLLLSENRIEDIGALKGLNPQTLRELQLGNNRISDLSPLKDLKELSFLSLEKNLISHISPLKGLKKISKLYLSHNPVGEIGVLNSLPNLSTIYLYNSQITDLSPLKGLPKLSIIGLEQNMIADISPLLESPYVSNYRIVYLKKNPLIPRAQIDALKAKGVRVNSDYRD